MRVGSANKLQHVPCFIFNYICVTCEGLPQMLLQVANELSKHREILEVAEYVFAELESSTCSRLPLKHDGEGGRPTPDED